jgi:hypothetical protein
VGGEAREQGDQIGQMGIFYSEQFLQN